MISTREKFLVVLRAFLGFDSTPESTISHRIFGRNNRIQEVVDGGDMQTANYDRAMQYFSDNWSDDVVWPVEIDRPAVSKTEAAE